MHLTLLHWILDSKSCDYRVLQWWNVQLLCWNFVKLDKKRRSNWVLYCRAIPWWFPPAGALMVDCSVEPATPGPLLAIEKTRTTATKVCMGYFLSDSASCIDHLIPVGIGQLKLTTPLHLVAFSPRTKILLVQFDHTFIFIFKETGIGLCLLQKSDYHYAWAAVAWAYLWH